MTDALIRGVGDVFIIDLEEGIDTTSSDRIVADVVRELVSRGKKNIILNLTKATRFDNVHVLINAQGRVQSWWRGELKLLNPPKRIRDTLLITKLGDHLEIFDNEDEAIKSFALPSVVKSSYRFTP